MTSSLEQEIQKIKDRLEELFTISNTILHLLITEEEKAYSDEISVIKNNEDTVSEEILFKELTS
jgi:hypothetical protein